MVTGMLLLQHTLVERILDKQTEKDYARFSIFDVEIAQNI